jgi:ketosteroid isomerase-like protein
MDPVRRFVEAFNRNDIDGMQAACTETTWIIDDFPPHEWSGRHATSSWYVEMARMARGYGMSEWSITLGDPRRVIVSEDLAYVAVPADVRWLQGAKPSERDCLMTMSLREIADGWRISSLAWAWS